MYINKKIKIYSSEVIDYEIENISEGNKKRQVEDFYDALEIEKISYSDEIDKRVETLKEYNVHYMDAYHIAFAESKRVDYFITCLLYTSERKDEIKLGVKVEQAPGEKCERCWMYSETVGEDKENPTICHRCSENLK